jgi:hypothetical protein
MRKIALIGMMLVMLGGSFFATLWLTDTGTSPTAADGRSDAERLASQRIFNRSDLIQAAVAAGLHSSTGMKGNVDSMRRVNDREVAITGWLAAPEGDATPLTLLIFVDGKKTAAAQTRGERSDVTKLLGLAFGAERDVAFEVSFVCPTGSKPVLIGLGPGKQYFYLSSPQCA